MTNPTIAVIAGAAFPPTLYDPLLASLKSAGYDSVVSEPPSITAEDASTVTVDTDISYVKSSVLAPLFEAGKDVVLLLHSYGGAYGAAAAQGVSKKEREEKGLEGGVVGIVYVASFVTEPGQSALEALGISDLAGSGIIFGDKPGTLVFSDLATLWPSLDAAEGAFRIAKLQPCSVSAIMTPQSDPYVPYEDSKYAGKIAIIDLEDDALITVERKKAYQERSGIKKVVTLKGGHGFEAGGETTEAVVKSVVGLIEGFGKEG